MNLHVSPTASRRPAVSGLFYRDDAEGLRREVHAYIDAGTPTDLVPLALIVPHAGYVYSGAVAGSAYRSLANLDRTVRRVYLLGPAHRVYTAGVAAPSHGAFSTPLGDVPVDQGRIEALSARFDFIEVNDSSHAEEHSLEVHLPFLQVALDDFALVPFVVGDIDPGRLAELFDAILDDAEGLVVVSSDLSHYLDYDEARLIDAETVAGMEQLEWRQMRPERACGYIPVSALLVAASRRGYQVSALDVRNSGDTAGPRDRVVGYASLVVHDAVERIDPRSRGRLVKLARNAIAHRLQSRSLALDTASWPAACTRLAATFVTLTRDGQLRGCIGSLAAEEPLVMSVANNAVRAAFHDPRFAPLVPGEMDHLAVSISVLSPPLPLAHASEEDLMARLRPGEDGLILSYGRQRGTFLPSVWDSLRTPRAFLEGLKRKAALPADFWSPDIVVERYTTESFGDA